MPRSLTVRAKLLKSLRYPQSIERCHRKFSSKNEDKANDDEKTDTTAQNFSDSNEFVELGIPEPRYANVNVKKDVVDMLKDDWKRTLSFLRDPSRQTWKKHFIPHNYDVAIFGAGVIGSTLANLLKERLSDDISVIVIDVDLSPDKFMKQDAV